MLHPHSLYRSAIQHMHRQTLRNTSPSTVNLCHGVALSAAANTSHEHHNNNLSNNNISISTHRYHHSHVHVHSIQSIPPLSIRFYHTYMYGSNTTSAISCPASTTSNHPFSYTNSTNESLDCMNRNKRWVKKANHGARPCNSVGRKSRTLGFGSWKVPRPNQTHNKISNYVTELTKKKYAHKEEKKKYYEEQENLNKKHGFTL